MLTSRDETTFRKPLRDHSVMLPHLLRSGIFSQSKKTATDKRPLPNHDDISDTSRGGSVSCRGGTLLQTDMRVLLGLMKRAGGLPYTDATLDFGAKDFLEGIGRVLSTEAVRSLLNSLLTLSTVTLVVKHYENWSGHTFRFVNKVSWEKRQFRVTLSPELRHAFDSLGRTYMPLTVRNRLTDGVQTALADAIYATSAGSFDVEALANVFGREPNEYGRELRKAMPKLVAAGVLTSWSATRGRIHVERARLN